MTVRSCRYSVPVRMIGRKARVVLRSSELIVYDKNTEVARHPRLTAKGAEHLVLDHYLEALMRKPGAMPGSVVLDQARASGAFTAAHDAWWAAARKALLFIAGWLGSDPARLAASFDDYVGDPAYSLQDLHTDLARFVFLLGGDDGEDLFGTPGTGPPA